MVEDARGNTWAIEKRAGKKSGENEQAHNPLLKKTFFLRSKKFFRFYLICH